LGGLRLLTFYELFLYPGFHPQTPQGGLSYLIFNYLLFLNIKTLPTFVLPSLTAEMEKFYIEVIRFKNYEIENDIDKVINKITELVNKRLESPPWGI
jgi:hypothetical protein